MEKKLETSETNKEMADKKYSCKELDTKEFNDDKFNFICPSCGFRWNK